MLLASISKCQGFDDANKTHSFEYTNLRDCRAKLLNWNIISPLTSYMRTWITSTTCQSSLGKLANVSHESINWREMATSLRYSDMSHDGKISIDDVMTHDKRTCPLLISTFIRFMTCTNRKSSCSSFEGSLASSLIRRLDERSGARGVVSPMKCKQRIEEKMRFAFRRIGSVFVLYCRETWQLHRLIKFTATERTHRRFLNVWLKLS